MCDGGRQPPRDGIPPYDGTPPWSVMWVGPGHVGGDIPRGKGPGPGASRGFRWGTPVRASSYDLIGVTQIFWGSAN